MFLKGLTEISTGPMYVCGWLVKAVSPIMYTYTYVTPTIYMYMYMCMCTVKPQAFPITMHIHDMYTYNDIQNR